MPASRRVVGVNSYQAADETRDRHPEGRQCGRARAADREARARCKAERDRRRCRRRSTALTEAARAGDGNLSRSPWTRRAPRPPSAKSRWRWKRCSAAIAPRSGRSSGVYKREVGMTDAVAARARMTVEAFEEDEGRRPRILVAKMGQDGHDRGQKVIASAFADLGFDVDIGPLFATPGGGRASGGRKRRAHRRRLVARRRPSDARAGAQGSAREARPRRHHDRRRRRHSAAGLRGLKAGGASASSRPGTVIAEAAEIPAACAQHAARPYAWRGRMSACQWRWREPLGSTTIRGDAIRAGDRAVLARAITLVESSARRSRSTGAAAAAGAVAAHRQGAAHRHHRRARRRQVDHSSTRSARI